MQHRMMSTITRLTTLVTTIIAVGTLACASDAAVPTDAGKLTTTAAGSDTSHSPPTSTGPVASLTATPHQLTTWVGQIIGVYAVARDANGVWISGKRPTWTTSNPAVIAVMSDTGMLVGKAPGTAKVYATLEGKIDSITITVTQNPPADTTSHQTSVTAVGQFNLTVLTSGWLAGTDTTRTEIVAGTKVTVTRVMGIHGDTLTPGVLVTTLTTDATGSAHIAGLAGGAYQFVATPPAGSPYLLTSTAIGAPTNTDVTVRITMRRAP